MEIDEISLVDKGANQHAMVTIAKRAPEEETMPEFYSEDGELLDLDSIELEEGDVVYDEDGNAYEFTTEEQEPEKELAEVGKSAFFNQNRQVSKKATASFSESVMEELSKAFSDEDRDKVIAKALGRVEELEKRYSEAEKIAKSERDLRLTREYISKAAEYNLPVDPQELGPVLYRMAESMSYEDCAVIAKCLESTGEILFQEVGYQGGGDNNDVMSVVEAHANEVLSKSADVSKAATISGLFDNTPEAYDEYLASQRGRY